ncbi:MAG: hypothetical protein WCH46_02820 [bacterium]
MRFIFELLAGFFIVSIIFRKIIAPFLEGLNGMGGQRSTPREPKQTPPKPTTIDQKKIQDAEFEEIT